MDRMRAELGRARLRVGHVVMLEQASSPMDLNSTVEVSAAIIADCVARVSESQRDVGETKDPIVDEAMQQAARGTQPGRTRYTA